MTVMTDGVDEPGFQVDGWPAFPAGVQPHPSVLLDSDDPARVEGRKTRQCAGIRHDGERCGAVPMSSQLLCALHAGRLDSAEGGRKRAEIQRRRREQAEEELGRRSLGTRAAILHVLVEEQRSIEATVRDLAQASAAGDRKAQALLLPYLNQALGMPTERVQHDLPSTPDELASAPTEALAALVAEGRKRRLQAVDAA